MAKWGYKPDGSAFIFEGELPEGWSDTPDVIEDEEARTAEALTASMEELSRSSLPEPQNAPRRRGRPPKVVEDVVNAE